MCLCVTVVIVHPKLWMFVPEITGLWKLTFILSTVSVLEHNWLLFKNFYINVKNIASGSTSLKRLWINTGENLA